MPSFDVVSEVDMHEVTNAVDQAKREVANRFDFKGTQARQTVTLRQGLDTPLAKQIVKLVKDSTLKVQTAIQGEKVRVTGKKKDDLQQVMALLRQADLDLPLQFDNFRD
ncbi:MAG: DUF520 family protein [Gammaproteobacteria bacterium]